MKNLTLASINLSFTLLLLLFLLIQFIVGAVRNNSNNHDYNGNNELDSPSLLSLNPTDQFPITFQPFFLPPFTNYGYIQLAYRNRLLPTLIFGFFGTVCPITVQKFLQKLDAHHHEIIDPSIPITSAKGYKGTFIYRIVKDGLIQGGRIQSNSVNSSSKFELINSLHKISIDNTDNDSFNDSFNRAPALESCCVPHDRPGIISACPTDSQDSDFFINLHRANSLDKSYTAFGLVISGLETIQFLCKDIPIHPTLEIPMSPVVIYDCGWRNLSSKFHLQASPINH